MVLAINWMRNSLLILFVLEFEKWHWSVERFSRFGAFAQQQMDRIKITTECGAQLITLHVEFSEELLPNRRFSDWIIVGNTMRPECRLKGNGEVRYIVQIAVLNDPCATKMISPGVFQNTLRIASFPGLILSDDLNYSFKCAYGVPEVTEFRLPQSSAIGRSSTSQSLAPGTSSGLINGLGQPGLPPMLITGTEQHQQLNSPSGTFQISAPSQPNIHGQSGFKVAQNFNSLDNTFFEKENSFPGHGKDRQTNGNKNLQQKEDAANDAGDFDMGNQWEHRRNSLSSNVVVGMATLLGIFLLACVLLALFFGVKQFKQSKRPSPFAHLDSRTSPGDDSASSSPASDESRVQNEWRRASDSNSTAAASNAALRAATMEDSFISEHLNLDPSLPLPAPPSAQFHQANGAGQRSGQQQPKQQQQSLLLKSVYCATSLNEKTANVFNDNEAVNSELSRGGRLLPTNSISDRNERVPPPPPHIGLNGKQRKNDNEALREDFNAAACRSITEIYRSAEMKLKSMMQADDTHGSNDLLRRHAPANGGEYSTPMKMHLGKAEEQQQHPGKSLLLGCVNKIRGYGTRKLTEQEMLRWRQLVRNDPDFENLVSACRTMQELHKVSELPQYRLLFTKLKWTQIVQCIGDELLGNGTTDGDVDNQGINWQKNGNSIVKDAKETVHRTSNPPMPMPLFGQRQQQAASEGSPSGNLKIFVGRGFNQVDARK